MNAKYVLILSICITFFLSSCQTTVEQNDTESKPVIRIAFLPITHSIPLLVQNELEKNSELPYKIELVKFTTWPELVDALRQGKVDGASVLFEVAIKASESSDDLKLVSLSHRDGNVVVSNKNIQSFKDLKDKIVAIPHKLSPHNTLLHLVLEKEGMTMDDIKVVEIAPADMPSSLVSGAISAFVVAEPYGSISASSDTGKILYSSKDIQENSACCVMVFNNGFLSEKPELMEVFTKGFMEAAKAADQKDAFVVDTYRNYINLKREVIEASLETISYHDLELTKEEYEQITSLAVKYKILDVVPEYEDFIYLP